MSTYRKHNATVDLTTFDNCPAFLERYLHYRYVFTNISSGTVVELFTILREFCQYIHYRNKIYVEPSTSDAHKDMDITQMDIQEACDLSQEDLERYLGFLEDKVKNSPNTICKKLAYIRNFYLYLECNASDLNIHLPHGNPARFVDGPQTSVNKTVLLTENEIQMLAGGTTGENALRDRAIILMLATTGMQTSELISLDRGDIQGKNVRILSPKRSRTVYMTEACRNAVTAYLRQTSEFQEPHYPLFLVIPTGKRLTARAIQLRIEKAAAVAKLTNKNVTARMLRNTAAEMLYRSLGRNSEDVVRQYMGLTSKYSMRNILQEPGVNEQILEGSALGQIGMK